MKQFNNIAEILKNYPKGTKFWSDSLGNVKLVSVDVNDPEDLPIHIIDDGGKEFKLTKEGYLNKYNESSFPLISPSHYMIDWGKLLWKKGDILSSFVDGKIVAFDSFCDDFEWFYGVDLYDFNTDTITPGKTDKISTSLFSLTKVEGFLTTYNTAKLKLNRPKVKKLFKKGDIICTGNSNFPIMMFDSQTNDCWIEYSLGISVDADGKVSKMCKGSYPIGLNDNLRLAAEEEISKFNLLISSKSPVTVMPKGFLPGDILTLAIEGVDVKIILIKAISKTNGGYNFHYHSGIGDFGSLILNGVVFISDDNLGKVKKAQKTEADLLTTCLSSGKGLKLDLTTGKLKSIFKVRDWVLMKNHCPSSKWTMCQYSHKSNHKYIAVGGVDFDECILYNNLTKDFLGTSREFSYKFNDKSHGKV